MGEWQKIDENTPKGKHVLLSGFIHGIPEMGRWIDIGIQWIDGDWDYLLASSPPTHWRPLPPPSAREGEG